MAKVLMTVKDAIERMADDARAAGRPDPVLKTDRYSAMILVRALADEMGCYCGDLMRPRDCFGQYDGVKIEVIAVPNNDYREHFGVLAEIYDDQRKSA